MQNSHRLLIATKILPRLRPKESSFYSSDSSKTKYQKEEVNGKVAIITGGAQGIGFDLAQTLLKNGVKGVTLADNDCSVGEESCSRLCEEFGKGRVMFCQCDVMKSDNMDCVFQKTISHFKRLDLVVNNAGIMNDKKWESEITVNIGGCVIGSLLGLQYMSKSCHGCGGVVVNLANTASIQPLCGCPIYTMTQSAIVGFTRALGSGCQYLRTGVKVLGLCAGPTDTRMMHELKARAINEHFATELLQEMQRYQLQPTSFVSNGLLKILAKGDNGSIWVAHNCKEVFQIDFAACAEDMMQNQRLGSEVKFAKDKKDDEKIEVVVNGDKEFVCDEEKNPQESVNVCDVKEKEDLTPAIQLAVCLPPHESNQFCNDINPDCCCNAELSSQTICQDNNKSKTSESTFDSILNLKSSFGKTLASVFTSTKKTPEKSNEATFKKAETNKPKKERTDVDQKDLCKTLELCNELKNVLSNKCPKEAEGTISYPHPPPEHPPSQPIVKMAKKPDECDRGPKILDPNSLCKPKKDSCESTGDLCAEIKSNKIRFEDLCAKLQNNKSTKQDPCVEKCSGNGNQPKKSDDKKSACKDDLCGGSKKKQSSDKDVCSQLKPQKCKGTTKAGQSSCAYTRGKRPTGNKYDLRTGSCVNKKRITDEIPIKINYHGKPIEPFLPPHLSRSTTSDWKACPEIPASPDSPKDPDRPFGITYGVTPPKLTKTDPTDSGKSKHAKERKQIEIGGNKKSFIKSCSKQQGIATQAGQCSCAKVPAHKCTEGVIRYEDDKVLKISRREYVDEDNIAWEECTYECAHDGEEKNGLKVNENQLINSEGQECDFQVTPKRQNNFDTWQTNQQCEFSDKKTKISRTKRKPSGHRLPDPEEYEQMCMGSRIAWNRCPQFSVKLPNRPVEFSQGMRNAWARCNDSCSPDGEILAQQSSSADKQSIINATNDLDTCEDVDGTNDDEEACDGVKKAWAQCHRDCEEADALASANCQSKYEKTSKCQEEFIETTNETEFLEESNDNDKNRDQVDGIKNSWAVCHRDCEEDEAKTRNSGDCERDKMTNVSQNDKRPLLNNQIECRCGDSGNAGPDSSGDMLSCAEELDKCLSKIKDILARK